MKISEKHKWRKPNSLDCQVATDPNTIELIVSRRHNGTDKGRGQLQWDTRAKANHANRVGATNQYPIAEAVENFLEANGYPRARKIGRSTLYRLINAKIRQSRFGINLNDDGSLGLTKPKPEVLELLSRVADDIVDKKITLKNVLNSEGVNEYINVLENDGLISPDNDSTSTKKSARPGDKKERKQTTKAPRRRDTLIPKEGFDIAWQPGQHKVELVWQELQFNLKFSKNPIAIPVVFRSLIELVTDRAISKAKLKSNGKLSGKVRNVAKHLHENELLSGKALTDLERHLGDSKSPRELEALNRAIHVSTFMPSDQDLLALWTAFEDYLLHSIRL